MRSLIRVETLEEIAMTYRLSIGGKPVGEMETLQDCWVSIDAAYGQFEDRYSGGLRFRITGLTTGWSVREAMVGGIWDACCETALAFQMYLRIGGWHEFEAAGNGITPAAPAEN